MVKKAALFICRYGPATEQDRWERNSGFSPYTLSLVVSALVIAGMAAKKYEPLHPELAAYLLDTADSWNALIEAWTYHEGSELARSHGEPGFYCRIVSASKSGLPDFLETCFLGNSELAEKVTAPESVSPDVWALVRYGLRRADDPRILATTRVVDDTLKTETQQGPVWHRYNFDGYGETREGMPFENMGIGRCWPLLTGERAHLELAKGNRSEALNLLETFKNFADESGLLPEQVWDSADIPERNLFLGRPTCSARPLVWTHAELIQLLRSLQDDHVFSCPRCVAERYLENNHVPGFTPWRFNLQSAQLIPGTRLRIEIETAAEIHWEHGATKGWVKTTQGPAGLHLADLPTENFSPGNLSFTFYWDQAAHWEEKHFSVQVT